MGMGLSHKALQYWNSGSSFSKLGLWYPVDSAIHLLSNWGLNFSIHCWQRNCALQAPASCDSPLKSLRRSTHDNSCNEVLAPGFLPCPKQVVSLRTYLHSYALVITHMHSLSLTCTYLYWHMHSASLTCTCPLSYALTFNHIHSPSFTSTYLHSHASIYLQYAFTFTYMHLTPLHLHARTFNHMYSPSLICTYLHSYTRTFNHTLLHSLIRTHLHSFAVT